MSPDEVPDVEELAKSMLVLYGPHDDHDADDHEAQAADDAGTYRPYVRTPLFPVDPDRYEAMRAATQLDSERYLHSGLAPVGCRYCGTSVDVKKLGPGHTAVQWDSASLRRCRYFTERREAGYDSSRIRGCPHLAESIRDAVAAGLLDDSSEIPDDAVG